VKNVKDKYDNIGKGEFKNKYSRHNGKSYGVSNHSYRLVVAIHRKATVL